MIFLNVYSLNEFTSENNENQDSIMTHTEYYILN